MGALRRLGGAVVVGLFVLRYALRPLGGTAALAELPREWSELRFVLPMIALSGLLVVLAGLAVRRGEGAGTAEFRATDRRSEDDNAVPDRYQNHPAVSPDPADEEPTTRIEPTPPDAKLREHFAHLETALDDPAVREELETLESVARAESDREIPARCPAEGCAAVWSGRTPLGIRTDRYELLAERRVVCLDCEEVVDLSSS